MPLVPWIATVRIEAIRSLSFEALGSFAERL
jgi:hypothetical protein